LEGLRRRLPGWLAGLAARLAGVGSFARRQAAATARGWRGAVRMWTIGSAIVRLRVGRVSARRLAGGGRRAAPVSPAPVRGPQPESEPPAPPDGAETSAPSWRSAADASGTSSIAEPTWVLPVRPDTRTTLLRTVPAPTADLWDDELHFARPRAQPAARTLLRRWAHVLIPAALACILGAIGLGRPALWTDELATWGMATTAWSEFWPVLRYVDAVLAPYYAFMHVWVDVFGDSDLALRAPSLLAMTASAGLIGAIGDHLSGRAVGLFAGATFALLASTSRFAAEARPYAISVLAACVATWLLLRAWQRPSAGRWVAYGVSVVVLGGFQLVGLLLVAGHAWTTLAWRRGLWWRFAIAAAAGVAASLALLVYGYRQRNQVAYIEPVGADTLDRYAAVLFGGAGVAIVLVLLGLFGLPLRMPSAVFTAWAVVPTAALLAVSAVLPMFLPRYLAFTTPGWALLAGVTLSRLRPVWVVTALVLLAGLGGPAHIQARGTDGHGQDTRELAMLVGQGVEAGDGIVYADDEPIGSWTARDAIAHYLPAPYRPQDVLATQPPRTGGLLLARECVDLGACLGERERLWIVRTGTLADPLAGIGESKEDLLRERYRVTAVWHPTGLTLALLERNPEAS
jgi:mannosyltransferase